MCICLWVCAWTLQVFPARTRRGHWVPCSGIKGGVGCQTCSEPNPGPLKNNTGFPLLSYLWSCRQCSCFRDGWLIYHKVIFCMCFEVFQQRKWRTQYTEYSESKQWEFLCFKISKKKKKTFQKSIFFWEKLLLQSLGWLLPSGPQVPRSPSPGITDRPQRTGFANVFSLASVTFLTIRKHNLKLSKLFISSGCPDCMLVSTQRRPLSVYQLQLCLKTRTPPSYSPLKILQRIPGSEL